MYRMTPDEPADESHFVGLVAEGGKFRLVVESDDFNWERAGVTRGTLESIAMQAGAAMREAKRALPEEIFVTDNLKPGDQLAFAVIVDAAMSRGYRQGRP